jgi:hypothetical protein
MCRFALLLDRARVRVAPEPSAEAVAGAAAVAAYASDARVLAEALAVGVEYFGTLDRQHLVDDLRTGTLPFRAGMPGDFTAWLRRRLHVGPLQGCLTSRAERHGLSPAPVLSSWDRVVPVYASGVEARGETGRAVFSAWQSQRNYEREIASGKVRPRNPSCRLGVRATGDESRGTTCRAPTGHIFTAMMEETDLAG